MSLFPHRQKTKKIRKTTEKTTKADGKKKTSYTQHMQQHSPDVFPTNSSLMKRRKKQTFLIREIASHHRQRERKKPKRNNTIPACVIITKKVGHNIMS